MARRQMDRMESASRHVAEPCPACSSPIYRRVIRTEITVHFDARMEYDGMYYYHRRHRCVTR